MEKRRGRVLTLQNRVAQAELLAGDVTDQIRQEREALRGRLFQRDRPPLWDLLSEQDEPFGVRFRSALARDAEALRLYWSTRTPVLVFHGLLLALALGLVFALRRRGARRAPDDPRQRFTALVAGRPVSMALLLALMASPWLYPGAPTIQTDLLGLALLVPALRLLPPLLGGGAQVS